MVEEANKITRGKVISAGYWNDNFLSFENHWGNPNRVYENVIKREFQNNVVFRFNFAEGNLNENMLCVCMKKKEFIIVFVRIIEYWNLYKLFNIKPVLYLFQYRNYSYRVWRLWGGFNELIVNIMESLIW